MNLLLTINRIVQTANDRVVFAAPELCVDNAIMIGWNAIEYMQAGIPPDPLIIHGDVKPEWSLESLKV